jgi:alpha-beta hydrolase superfamily lysophospholipase
VNQAKTIRLIFSLLTSTTLVLAGTSQAWADQCVDKGLQSTFGGLRCTEDPSCVIVGDTHMLEWKSTSPAKIFVVCIHGLGLCARAYKPLAQKLSEAGVDGFGVNVRGFGPDRDKADRAKLNCVETVADVSKLLANIHKEYPDYKVFLVGESMGGALAIRIAAENPDLVDGVVCSAPAWKLLKIRRTAVKGIFELLLPTGTKPGPASRGVMHQATSDETLTEHWLTDPSHKLTLSAGEARSFLTFISKADRYAKQLTKPVMVVQGLNDHLVSSVAVAKLFKDIPSKNKTFIIVGNGEHLVLEEGLFSPALTTKLMDWLKTGYANQAASSTIDVIDDSLLSPAQMKRRDNLLRLARTGGVQAL